LIEGDLDIETCPLALDLEVIYPLLLDGQRVHVERSHRPRHMQQQLIGFIGETIGKSADRFTEAQLQQQLIGHQRIDLDLLQGCHGPGLAPCSGAKQQGNSGYHTYCCFHRIIPDYRFASRLAMPS